jgi:integrase
LKEVQDRLGHSDVQTTMNIYAHVTKKAKEEAILKFANYIEMQMDDYALTTFLTTFD